MIRLSGRVAPRIDKPHIRRKGHQWSMVRQGRRLGDFDQILVSSWGEVFPRSQLAWACGVLRMRTPAERIDLLLSAT